MAAAIGKALKYLPQAMSIAQELSKVFGQGKARCNKVKKVIHDRMTGGKVHIGDLMKALPKAKKFVEGEVAHLVKPIAEIFGVGEEYYDKIHDYLKSRGHMKGGAWLPTWDQLIDGAKAGVELYKVAAPLLSTKKKGGMTDREVAMEKVRKWEETLRLEQMGYSREDAWDAVYNGKKLPILRRYGGYNSAPNKPDQWSPESLARQNERLVAERERKSANYNNFLRSGMSQLDAWNAAYGVQGGAWLPSWDQLIDGAKAGVELYKVAAPLLSTKKKGGACSKVYQPVMATNGRQYGNMCELREAGATAVAPLLSTKKKGGACSAVYRPVMATNGRKYGNMCQLREAGATAVESGPKTKVGGNAIWDANFCDSMKGNPNDPAWCKSNRYNRTGVYSGGAWLPTWDQVIDGAKAGVELYNVAAPLLSSGSRKGSPGYKSPLSSKGGRKRGPTRHALAVKRVMEEHGMKLADASRYVKEHGLASM